MMSARRYRIGAAATIATGAQLNSPKPLPGRPLHCLARAAALNYLRADVTGALNGPPGAGNKEREKPWRKRKRERENANRLIDLAAATLRAA